MSEIYPARYHDDERWVCALIKVGTKRMKVLCLEDSGLRVLSVPKEEERYATRVDVPLAVWAKKFRGIARRQGATEAAKEMLDEASGSDNQRSAAVTEPGATAPEVPA